LLLVENSGHGGIERLARIASQAPVGISNVVTLQGNVATANGNGGGNMDLAWRYVVIGRGRPRRIAYVTAPPCPTPHRRHDYDSKTWFEGEFNVGSGTPFLQGKIFRSIDAHTYVATTVGRWRSYDPLPRYAAVL
jgi:hypothetical protein